MPELPETGTELTQRVVESPPPRIQQLEQKVRGLETNLEGCIEAVRELHREVGRWRRYSPGGAVKRERQVRNAALGIGLAVLSAGCWWVYPPLGLIVPGAVVLVGAVYGTLRAASTGQRRQ